ncbi:MBL fold metallo-hydrolase, partial [bacterium]|nr:MBL fold metallo-hydrolase [bacterium]
MRPSFLPRLVNGALFDPVVYVRILNEKRALMFDCGHFLSLSERELLAVEALCISHLHMDHFMGFDRVLRSILHRQAPLDIYGPDGIIEKTLAKLDA